MGADLKSLSIYEQSRQLIPGGVNSPVRAFAAVGGEPVVMKSGKGAWLKDVDGNSYIDYIGSWGPMILGHAEPHVIAAVKDAAERSTSFGAPTEAELDLARLINEAVPSMEMLRLTNSGTEAVMGALRVARGFTGRDMIVKCVGCYHGGADYLLVKAGSGAATLGSPDSAGVPKAFAELTVLVPYNDIEAVRQVFTAHKDNIAALIIEPVAGNMGCVPPQEGYLQGLRELCSEAGVVLVFDEVMTGFRVHHGGAQARYGVRPDLSCFGKIVGGGLPVGAYGGRSEMMQKVAPLGPVYQAGTLSGNPLATAAGIAMLSQLKRSAVYETLEKTGAQLERDILEAANQVGVTVCVQRVASMLTVFFTKGPVRHWDDASACDTKAFAQWHRSLLQEGVYWPPSQFEAAFVSICHDAEVLSLTKKAMEKAFLRLKQSA
ncbi:MAG: glutamate-1-semialdehyde 2,1-aminomutase [Myxococcales bacterium]|nr:MAG: glutamate-1-semialdehyde 2,1-aminomutase [Myxococcales bacterium]